MRHLSVSAAALLLALGGGTAWAAGNTADSAAPPPPNQTAGTATTHPAADMPSQRNPLLADNGDVRIGKLIGTNVYDKNDHKLGSVDGVLAGHDGQLQVVISTNNKKVLVPWNALQFGNAKENSDNKVLMPGETEASLNNRPNFNYQNQNRS